MIGHLMRCPHPLKQRIQCIEYMTDQCRVAWWCVSLRIGAVVTAETIHARSRAIQQRIAALLVRLQRGVVQAAGSDFLAIVEAARHPSKDTSRSKSTSGPRRS